MADTERLADEHALALLCPTCHRLLPLPGCLHLTETWAARQDTEGIVAVHAFLSGLLRRPPVVNGGEGMAPLRGLLEALRRDLALLPSVDDSVEAMPDHQRAGGLPWAPHPAMAAAERGVVGTEDEPGHVGYRTVDGWGIER